MEGNNMKKIVTSLALIALLVGFPSISRPMAHEPRSVQELAMFRAAKFDAHYRVPHEGQILKLLREERVPLEGASQAEVEGAVHAFMQEWVERNPTTPNPKKLRQLLKKERQAAKAGKSPKQKGWTLADPIQTLVVLVEFPGTDTFTYSAEDPVTGACYDEVVTTSGPLHNEIVLGPRDNNTFWLDDFTPEVYDELYFGVGPDAGVIVDHPNLGQMDLRGLTVANYFLEQSEGLFKPEGFVYPRWLQAAHSEGWYGADSCETGSHNVRARDLVMETVDLLNADDAEFPWQDFDADGDGVVDNFTVIHAGLGQEAGGGGQGDFSIWSHAASVDYLACTAVSVGCPDRDIRVGSYSMDPENFDVGVGAEEFGHAAFGLPDIYTTDYQLSVSNWAIMEAGAWNGPLAGMQPAPFPGWFRYVVGWWDPVEVNYDDPAMHAKIGQLSLRPPGREYGMKINVPPREEFIPNLAGDGKGWHTDIPDLGFAFAWSEFDLTAATGPVIFSFDTWFAIEYLWDYGFFEVPPGRRSLTWMG
jgi:immune inhibitor A